MSLINRVVKTGGGTDFLPGNDVLAEEMNGDLNTLYSDYDGGITNANCAPDMGLEGTKLANAPVGIPTTKYNDDSVTATKLALTFESVAFTKTYAGSEIPIGITPHRFLSGANYVAKLMIHSFDSSVPAANIFTLTVTPLVNIPSATKQLIGMYLDNITITNSGLTISGNVVFISLRKT